MSFLGFIGYGSMAKMLISSFIRYGKIDQEQIIVTRKNKDRLDEISMDWPRIGIADEIREVVCQSDYIFICVKPFEFARVLKDIKPYLKQEQHIISIAGSVWIKDMEKIIDSKITKLLPTVVSEVQGGITLICHNEKVTYKEQQEIEDLVSCNSKLRPTKEEDFGFASEFTSCGPGLYAKLFQEFAEAGARHGDNFTKEEIYDMVLTTLIGTTKLMQERSMDFIDVINRVTTKGGITEEGVKVFEEGLPLVFDEAFQKMMYKREVVSGRLHEEFIKSME